MAVATLLAARNCTTRPAGAGVPRAASHRTLYITQRCCCPTVRCWWQGDTNGGFLTSAELYDIGLGFTRPDWQPQITTATSPLLTGTSLVLTGSRFQGISQASGGNFQDSSTNYPVVQLRAIDNSQVAFLPVDPIAGWSDTSFTSTPVNNFPPGPALVTVFTNGIPSDSEYLVVESTTSTPTPTPTPTPATHSLWDNSTVPAVPSQNDPGAVEVGTKFSADVDGQITGFKFYKGTTNTGLHTGHLWTTGGQLLATATFTNETASGWQEVTLDTPVPVTANTTYIVSYHAPNGNYAANSLYFTTGYDNAPLHSPASDPSGGNGIYHYGPSGTFPTEYL